MMTMSRTYAPGWRDWKTNSLTHALRACSDALWREGARPENRVAKEHLP
jgi:hypothetical protein